MRRDRIKVGVKAGGISGLVWGVLLVPYTSPALFTADVKDQVVSFLLARSVDPGMVELIYVLLITFLIGFVVIFLGVVGAVLGAIYGWACKKIPGKTSQRKGLIFGGFFWTIQILGVLATVIQRNLTPLEILRDTGIAIAYSLAFGILLAIFYNRYKLGSEATY